MNQSSEALVQVFNHRESQSNLLPRTRCLDLLGRQGPYLPNNAELGSDIPTIAEAARER